MKKNLHYLLTAITIFITINSVLAQSDLLEPAQIKPLCGSDSLIDLGRVKIRKDFAQTVTIKARDLERMPFDNLADAIAPFLHGAMSSQVNLVYVIDGNLMNDVNAFSIHDIDEITLVQNAMTRVNGALKLQQLVLIKTKRYSASNHFSVSGQSFLVNNQFNTNPGDVKSENNFYHQYTVTAWKALGETRIGLNANFLRDVFPDQKDDLQKTKKPYHLNRYRFYGWFDALLGEGHALAIRLNFVPQTTGYDYRSVFNENSRFDFKTRQTLFNPSIKLTNRITEGLTNEINFSYLTARVPSGGRYSSISGQDTWGSVGEGLNKVNNFLIRENLSYHKNFGEWQLVPALNFTFRSVKDYLESFSAIYTNGVLSNQTISKSTRKGEVYVLSPSLSLAYGNSFNIVGGFATDLGDDTDPAGEGIFPFASLTMDVLRISNSDNPSSLKVFGSFSKGADFADLNFNQWDVTGQPERTPGNSTVFFAGPSLLTGAYPESPKPGSIQGGLMYSTPGNRLQVSYNYDNRDYVDQMLRLVPFGPNDVILVATLMNYNYSGHRLGVTSRIVDKPDFSWNMSINATTFKIKYKNGPVTPLPLYETFNNDGKTLWTGGFTNRVLYKKFSFGLDLLYLLNEVRQSTIGTKENFNNWRINNAYAGYQLQVKGRPLEVYISTRNCLENKNSFFTDVRQFYGAGFKLQF